MNFKRNKIRKKIPVTKQGEALTKGKNLNRRLNIKIPIITFLVIIGVLLFAISKAVSSIDFNVFLEVAGDELQTDAFGHTNFMILGTGDASHEGSSLTDTIIVASLDKESHLVTMVSIPRDLYVKDDTVGSSRINEVYIHAKNHLGNSSDGIDHLKGKVEEIMGIPIHYWVKVNFQGFTDLIDELGGIDVNVKNSIHDPYYPKDGTFEYETFSISAGQHHLDGDTALKYARSRKTTSDFDRAERQQEIIYAIKEKSLQTETIISTEKIKGLLNVLKANIETNIKVKEIITLGSMAGGFSQDSILHRLMHDDPTQCGGFLYTPERQFYNGMFVLIPAGGFEIIHKYAELNFNYPLSAKEETVIHLLNGTGTVGVAGETKQILQRFCYDVNRFGNGNTKDVQETTYYYKEGERPDGIDFLKIMIPGKESTEIPEEYLEYIEATGVILEIGYDYVNSENYFEDAFYYLPVPKAATDSSEEATEGEATETPEATESAETTTET